MMEIKDESNRFLSQFGMSEYLLNMHDEFRVLSLIEWAHYINYIINYPIMKLG